MVNDTPEKKGRPAPDDYFRAYLEEGGLAMEPFCRCGQQLNEKYHCSACDRQCRCITFVCDDEATQSAVKKFIEEQPRFAGFRTALAEELPG